MSDSEERIQRYLAGEMTPEERVAFEDEVLLKPEFADRLYSDISIQAAMDTTARARREWAVDTTPAEPWWRRQFVRWLAPAVAVAAVAIFMIARQPQAPDAPSVFRGTAGELKAVEPQGDVSAAPSRFVWRASALAEHYRFELFSSSSSTPVFTTVIADTFLTVDPSFAEVPTQGYWVVTPLNDLRIGVGDAIITNFNTAD